MQRVSKNGNTYNVPTVKSTYLSKSQKVLLKSMIDSQIVELTESLKKSASAQGYALMSELLDLQSKLA
jgi:hypothetical protein